MSSPVEPRVECDPIVAPVKSSAARAEVYVPTDPANDESVSVSEQTEERGAVERSADPPHTPLLRGRPAVPGRRPPSPSPMPTGSRKRKHSPDLLEERLARRDNELLKKISDLIAAQSFNVHAQVPVEPLVKEPTLSSQPFFRRDAVGPQGSSASASNPPVVAEVISPIDLTGAAQEGEDCSNALSDGELEDEVPSSDIPDAGSDLKPEEQTLRETVRAVRGYMEWNHIPDIDSSANSEDDPFTFRAKPVGKVSLKMPADTWICKKLETLSLTLKSGYPSGSVDPSPLPRDHLLRHPTTAARWYDLFQGQDSSSSHGSSTLFWHGTPAKNNSTLPRVLKPSAAHRPPFSRQLSQETLRKWEKSVRTSSLICNHAAGMSRCLKKLEQDEERQCAAIRASNPHSKEYKEAVDELLCLLSFDHRVTASLRQSVKDLTESVFVDLGNLVLLRRDSYLEHLRPGVKADTAAALRSSALQLATLFPDEVLSRAEKEIAEFESRPQFVRKTPNPNLCGKEKPWKPQGGRAQSQAPRQQQQAARPQPKKQVWRKLAKKAAPSAAKGAPDKPSFPQNQSDK